MQPILPRDELKPPMPPVERPRHSHKGGAVDPIASAHVFAAAYAVERHNENDPARAIAQARAAVDAFLDQMRERL